MFRIESFLKVTSQQGRGVYVKRKNVSKKDNTTTVIIIDNNNNVKNMGYKRIVTPQMFREKSLTRII